MLATIKKEKKVGIVVNNGAHLFSNGLVQNAYFLHQAFEANGYTCQFLSIAENPSPFGHKDLTVCQFAERGPGKRLFCKSPIPSADGRYF